MLLFAYVYADPCCAETFMQNDVHTNREKGERKYDFPWFLIEVTAIHCIRYYSMCLEAKTNGK